MNYFRQLSLNAKLGWIIGAFAAVMVGDYLASGRALPWPYLITLAIGVFSLFQFLKHSVIEPMRLASESLMKISSGNFDVNLPIDQNDEPGQVLQGMQCMKIKLNFELENTQKIASEALRVKNALDVCNTNVMLADKDYNIIYMNESLNKMMKVAEPDLKTVLKHFEADKLMGCNMDIFHKDPTHQRKILDQATTTHSQEVEVAGRHIVITATPVFDDSKYRLGTVIEWLDRTDELRQRDEEQRIEPPIAPWRSTAGRR